MWLKHSTSDSAGYDTTVRLLAGPRRAPLGPEFGWIRNSEFSAVRAVAHASRGMPTLRVPRLMPWRMGRTTTPAGRDGPARLLLSDQSRATPHAEKPRGREPRSAQSQPLPHPG